LTPTLDTFTISLAAEEEDSINSKNRAVSEEAF
jgi:hypothetical protein